MFSTLSIYRPISVFNQSAFWERRETLRTVKERAAKLCNAVEILNAGLTASRAQVHSHSGII